MLRDCLQQTDSRHLLCETIASPRAELHALTAKLNADLRRIAETHEPHVHANVQFLLRAIDVLLLIRAGGLGDLKGLILAQNERWRRGLGMQVVRETLV